MVRAYYRLFAAMNRIAKLVGWRAYLLLAKQLEDKGAANVQSLNVHVAEFKADDFRM